MSLVNNREEHEVYLEHYGAKGMKWGVRKARKTGRRIKKGAKKYKQEVEADTSSKRFIAAKPIRKAAGKAAAKITGSKLAVAAKKQHAADIKKAQERDAKILKKAGKMKKGLKAKLSVLNKPENREKVILGTILAATVVAKLATMKINSDINKMAEQAFTSNLGAIGIPYP